MTRAGPPVPPRCLGAPIKTVAPAAGTSGDPLAQAGIGSLTVRGTAYAHPHVADWLEALGATEGLADARYSTSTRTELEGRTVVQFDSSATVTPDALSHRHDASSAGSTASTSATGGVG